jgi:hypothetical protein
MVARGKNSMANYDRDPEYNWRNTIQEGLAHHGCLIDRLLIQMRLRGRYEKGDIINQLFIAFSNRVESGGIKVENADDLTIRFLSRNRAGEMQQVLSINAYLRTIIINYLRELFNQEKTNDFVAPLESLEHIEAMNHLNDSCFYEEDERVFEIKNKLKFLSYEDHRILELFFFEDLSYGEIAQCLKSSGFPPDGHRAYSDNNLRKKKQRALEKLRKHF